MQHPLMGVGVALVTPFDSKLNIDFDALGRLLEFTQDNVDYFVVQGTTGESATTTSKEKLQILDFVKKNNPRKIPIVYGLGGNNTASVLENIQNLDFEGIHAILSVTPYYNKPPQAGLVAHFTKIADASPVPVLLYNVPGRTVISIQVPTVLELAKHPNIIGIKDASTIENAMELAQRCPSDFLLLSGDDNLTTTSISIGFSGVISVIANAFPKEFHEMTWAALRGDYAKAKKIQHSFIEFDTLLYVESNPVGIKKCLEIKEICGSDVRLPLVKSSDGLGVKLENAMRAEGFI